MVKANDGELIILHDISFAIEAGESVAIVLCLDRRVMEVHGHLEK